MGRYSRYTEDKKLTPWGGLALILVFAILLGLIWGSQTGWFGRSKEPKGTTAATTSAATESTQAPESGETIDTYGLNDTEITIATFAASKGISLWDYPRSIVELLERNPETEEFVLNYPFEYGKPHEVDLSEYRDCETVPLFMQWDQRWGYLDYGNDVAGLTACGPVCLSMAAYYLTKDESMSPDRIIQFSIDNGYCTPGGGTASALISEGGEKLGLNVMEIPLDEAQIIRYLQAGFPIICITEPGAFTTGSNFIVLAGYENGKFRINDCNSYANSLREWDYEEFADQVQNLWVIRAG